MTQSPILAMDWGEHTGEHIDGSGYPREHLR